SSALIRRRAVVRINPPALSAALCERAPRDRGEAAGRTANRPGICGRRGDPCRGSTAGQKQGGDQEKALHDNSSIRRTSTLSIGRVWRSLRFKKLRLQIGQMRLLLGTPTG